MAKYYGTDGDNTITGTKGHDIFFASLGKDDYNGGGGIDEISFKTWSRGVTLDLTLSTFQPIGLGAKLRLTSFEFVTGSRYRDTIFGGVGDNVIWSGLGADTVYGREGDDALYGGAGTDTLNGGTYNDNVIGEGGDDELIGGAGNDVLDGGEGDDLAYYRFETSGITLDLRRDEQQYVGASAGYDTVFSIENVAATDYADTIFGSDANNTLYGNGGNDVLEGGAGDDVLWGGLETDTASYEHATGGVIVKLYDTAVQTVGGGAGTDQLLSIENVRGSSFDDVFYGIGAGNGFNGGTGTDWVFFTDKTTGVTANLAKGRTNDFDTFTSIENIVGTDQSDVIYGNDASNALYGQGGDDLIGGDLGNDTMNGGPGSDWAYYRYMTASLTIDLAITGSQNTGGAGYDTFQAIEHVHGSTDDDTLSGNDLSNTLAGGEGIDTLNGRGGNDGLNGGLDADVLTGGAGADLFVYYSVDESLPGFFAGDFIQDFSRAQHDRIMLVDIDARTNVTGNDAFTFIGNAAFTGVSGQLRFDYTSAANQYVVYGDVNGDRTADIAIYVVSDSAAPIATDFIL